MLAGPRPRAGDACGAQPYSGRSGAMQRRPRPQPASRADAGERRAPPEAAAAAERGARAGADEPARRAAPEPPRVVVPRWVQLVLLPLALLAAVGARESGGESAADLHRRGAHRADPQPGRRLPAALAPPARPGGAHRVPRILPRARRDRRAAGQPDLQPGDVVHAQPAAPRQRSEQARRRLRRATSTTHGIHVQLVKQGKTALQTLQDKLAKSASSIVSFGGALLTEAASAIFDLVLVFVLSVYMLRLRRADRHARAPRDARRRRHAAPTTTRRSCSARSRATSAGSCCSA